MLKYEYYTFNVLWFKNNLLEQREADVTKQNKTTLKTSALSSFTNLTSQSSVFSIKIIMATITSIIKNTLKLQKLKLLLQFPLVLNKIFFL